MKLVSTNLTNLVPLEQFHHKPMGMYDGGFLCDGMAPAPLLQWHKVCEIGGDELHRPPVVALSQVCLYIKHLLSH